MTHQNQQQSGFTLIEIMISVLLVGLLATIAIPNFIRSRTTAQTNACISNLRTIDYAIQQWAIEQKQAANAPVQFSDISSYLKNSVVCPAGGASFLDSYLISSVGTEPSCQKSPATHLIEQLAAQVVSLSSDAGGSGSPGAPGSPGSPDSSSSGSPPARGSPSSAEPSNGNNGNGNGNGNGNNGNNSNGSGNNGNGNGSNGNNP
jgi:prepilin-type N-terminal cleavage/methylation domain-containing protein